VHILLPVPTPPSRQTPFRVGRADAGRLATTTSVAFTSDDTLVSADLAGRRIHLVGFDVERGTHEVLRSAPTQTREGRSCETDLLSGGGALVWASDCGLGSTTCYDARTLEPLETVSLGADYVHGVHVTRDLVAWATVEPRRRVCVTRRGESRMGSVRLEIDVAPWRAKDVRVHQGKIVVVTCSSDPGPEAGTSYDSEVRAYDLAELFDPEEWGRTCSRATLPGGQADACAVLEDRVYVNDQTRGLVHAYELTMDGVSREPVATYDGYSFPHAVDVRRTQAGDLLLAVACYGSRSVDVRRIDGPGSARMKESQ